MAQLNPKTESLRVAVYDYLLRLHYNDFKQEIIEEDMFRLFCPAERCDLNGVMLGGLQQIISKHNAFYTVFFKDNNVNINVVRF